MQRYIYPAPLLPTAEALRSGREDLLPYLDRMCQRYAEVEPHVRAFVPEEDRCHRVRQAGNALLQAHPTPEERPDLFGVLLGVKDIFRTQDLPTYAGSRLPPELFEGPEATVVTTFRRAGTILFGKTVTTEFAYFAPGPTRNPHNLNHTPGGSSSGSAAAVAAGMVPLAIGTQTIGSVIRPAAFCGIVGFKPTYNRIPTDGLIYFSPSADHVGLFTQDVPGMRLAASVACQGWREDAVAQARERRPVLGIPVGPYLSQASEEGLAAFEEQVQTLEKAGYQVKRVPLLENIEEINTLHRQMIAAEFAMQHAEWFRDYGHLYRPRSAELVREGQQVPAEVVAQARSRQRTERARVEEVMDREGVDVWITPAAPGPAPEGIESTGNPIMNLPWTFMGLPAGTVPAGYASNGLPLGLQCVTHWMADEALLTWMEDLAQVLAKGVK
ncbi:MAG: amidase [Chloroflexi bacterium]|nr:amidase [Chloroflexota bacterium]